MEKQKIYVIPKTVNIRSTELDSFQDTKRGEIKYGFLIFLIHVHAHTFFFNLIGEKYYKNACLQTRDFDVLALDSFFLRFNI